MVGNVTLAIEPEPFDGDSYYQDPLGFFTRLRESGPVVPVRMPGFGRTSGADQISRKTAMGWSAAC
jgi:hypothetical protein